MILGQDQAFDALQVCVDTGALSDLDYGFARFVVNKSKAQNAGQLAITCALLSYRSRQGDVCVDLENYVNRPLFAAESPESIILGPSLADWRADLQRQEWVGSVDNPAPLILHGSLLYLQKFWWREELLLTHIKQRMALEQAVDTSLLLQRLHTLFPEQTRQNADQRRAVAIACMNRFCIISGGPGTGKTTTVIRVLSMLLMQSPDMHIALLAPTGKAAIRMATAIESGRTKLAVGDEIQRRIPLRAQTIHRFLRYGEQGPRYTADNPIAVNCVVVDEASMVDLTLMTQLLDAIPADCHLLLLGDREQLASVEAGSVLADLTGRGQEIVYSRQQQDLLEKLSLADTTSVSPSAPFISDNIAILRHSYRFAEGSGIHALAQSVNAGDAQQALLILQEPRWPDVQWVEETMFDECLEKIVRRYKNLAAQADVVTAFDRLQGFCVLSVTRHGEFGVETINQRVYQQLRSPQDSQEDAFHRGQPLIVERNDYETGLFNGDMGLAWPDEQGRMRAWFQSPEGGLRPLAKPALPQFNSAYAITVHKSQGSEVEEAVLVLPEPGSPLLTRELIYTAITRARKRLQIVGSMASFVFACEHRVQRNSGLVEKLRW